MDGPLISKEEIPQFLPDTRQDEFYSVLKEFRERHPDAGISPVNSSWGFHASRVDLGWLSDKLKELMKKDAVECDHDIMEVIRKCVQRVRSFDVEKKETGWKVCFSTQDDHGLYVYSFFV